MPQPPRRVRAQRLLTDHRAALQEQPSYPRALTLMQQQLGPNRWISTRQHPRAPSDTPRHRRAPSHPISSRAYTYARDKASAQKGAVQAPRQALSEDHDGSARRTVPRTRGPLDESFGVASTTSEPLAVRVRTSTRRCAIGVAGRH